MVWAGNVSCYGKTSRLTSSIRLGRPDPAGSEAHSAQLFALTHSKVRNVLTSTRADSFFTGVDEMPEPARRARGPNAAQICVLLTLAPAALAQAPSGAD